MFSKGMTRGDAYFHLLLAGCAVGGTLFAQGIGESLWQRHNSGVRSAPQCNMFHKSTAHHCFATGVHRQVCSLCAWPLQLMIDHVAVEAVRGHPASQSREADAGRGARV